MADPMAHNRGGSSPRGSLSPSLQVGAAIGRYRIESIIQQGATGEVFLVSSSDEGRNAPVVLKRLPLHAEDEDGYVDMFRAETQVMSRLRHPNIVAVVDSFETTNELGLALEYVRGRNLLQIQRASTSMGAPVPPGVAVYIMLEVLEGLHYAHTFVLDDGRPLDVVHRDITPGNILVAYDGMVKLTDFGISKSVMSRVQTRPGVVKGTTRYLSPEQIRAQPVRPTSDVFSSAVVLTELLTGQPLFDRGAIAPTLFAIVNRERPDVNKLLPVAAPELAAVLEQALATDPEHRPPTARALADGLRRAAQARGWAEGRDDLHALMARLFPEALTAPDRPPATMSVGQPRLDLTHLFGVEQEPSEAGPEPFEQELRALLQGTMSGSAPLDAEQFGRRAATPKAVTARRPEISASSQLLAMGVPQGAPGEPNNPSDAGSRALLDALDHVSSEIEALEKSSEPSSSEGVTIPGRDLPARRTWLPVTLALAVGAALGFGGGRLTAPEPPKTPPKAPPAQSPPPAPAPPVRRPPPKAKPPAPPPAKKKAPAKLAKPAKGPGYLTITSPRGARVYIDGKRIRRRVPLKKRPLKPGKHLIKIKKGRYLRIFEVHAKPGTHLDATGGSVRQP